MHMKMSVFFSRFKGAAAVFLAICLAVQLALPVAAEEKSDFSAADFLSSGGSVTDSQGGVLLSNLNAGDHHATSAIQASVFTFEADTEILSGRNAMLTFGITNRENPAAGTWYAICPNRAAAPHGGEARIFKVSNGALEIDAHIPMEESQITATTARLRVTVNSDKIIRFFMNDALILETKDDNWTGGYIGLATFDAQARFTNIRFDDAEPVYEEEGNFMTNLDNLHIVSGSWTRTESGLLSSGSGDCFAMSDTCVTDFTFEARVTVRSGAAASLVFGGPADGSLSYVANIDLAQGNARIFKFTGNGASTLTNYQLPNRDETEYILKIQVYNKKIQYFLNGLPAGSCEIPAYSGGYLGLLICNSVSVFNDVVYTSTEEMPRLSKLAATETDLEDTFDPTDTSYSYRLPYSTGKITLTPQADADSTLSVGSFDSDGAMLVEWIEAASGDQIILPLAEGWNKIYITVHSGERAGITTEVSIRREANPEAYYNEPYRPQYHVTPEEGWLNDPNGMVYFNGEYHLYYQYNPHTKFPGDVKYWGHVASTDMVHWEERPIALSPDEFGSMWSGSAVVDENNTSGLFSDVPGKQGLVAFYTVTASSQQQAMAYSTDGGVTWIKYNGGAPILTNADDPLSDGGFRDPKVFWHNESNQWMMVVAGGPLRFYSSSDLIHWNPEGMQGEIHTECPDFFPMPVDGDPENVKWVLSGGGVWYMIGDFEHVDGVWKFVPDTGERLDFNAGPDVYAGQTFYGTGTRRIMINWMVEIGYSYDTGHITDPWAGALSLPYELTLVSTEDGLRILQNPVEELSTLRKGEAVFSTSGILSSEDENILKDLHLSTFEIVADLGAVEGGKMGFRLRTGETQFTEICYDADQGNITVDRRAAGKNVVDRFATYYTAGLAEDTDRVRLHIFVDNSSVEVFVNDGELLFTTLIYPEPESDGLAFFTDGRAVLHGLEIYELSSIYRDKPEETRKIGDIDNDGEVTVSDVVELRKQIVSGTADSSVCDLDENGGVTVSDVVELRRLIVEGN